MTDVSPVEQRHRPRVCCSLAVQVHAPSEDVLLFTYATNMSQDGIYVRANRPLPVGTEVNLDLHPHATSERVRVAGRVVRVTEVGTKEPRGMGVCFAPLAAAGDAIRRVVARLDTRSMATAADPEAYALIASA